MGNFQSNIEPLNDKCPILLKEINKNGLLLNCKHIYDHFSLQKYCYINYILKKDISCPICRKKITKSDLKKIFKKWLLIELKYDNWTQSNVFDFNYILDYSCKMNTIKLNNDITLIQPLFYFDKKYSPVMLTSGFIKSLKKIVINKNSPLHKDRITIHGEYLDDLTLKFSSTFIDNIDFNDYYYYLCRIIPEFKYNGSRNLRTNKNKIYFYVADEKNVISYDINEGDMKETFIYKPRSCNVLFSTYLLYYNKKLNIINKIYSIIYN
jgi:hypothetical protein